MEIWLEVLTERCNCDCEADRVKYYQFYFIPRWPRLHAYDLSKLSKNLWSREFPSADNICYFEH